MGRGSVSTVSGVVTDEAGRPVAEAAVAFARAPVPVPDVAAVTGVDGRFLLAAPAPGAYTVVVSAPGRQGATADLRVEPGEATQVSVEVRLPPRHPGSGGQGA
jgi:Carboxypeptidase regulatory-like domain